MVAIDNKIETPAPTRWPAERIAIVLVGMLAAATTIWAIDAFAPSWVAVMLLDQGRSTWPLTVQNLEWLAFGFGAGELAVRLIEARRERAQLARGYLPEDASTILQAPELRRLYSLAREGMHQPGRAPMLPRLIHRIVVHFQTNRSVGEASAVLDSSIELFQHEIDLRYTLVRYAIWVIPTLGFLGTVLGISLSLNYAGSANLQDPTLLAELTKQMAVAFDTTMLALCLSAVLVLAQHLIQQFEERVLNQTGQYCLDNLINRLFAG
jgi:biopolymer transport protein ExbB/TolQ